MMAATRRRSSQPPDAWAWLRDLVSYWPVLVSTLAIVAFILNAQRDIADINRTVVEMQRQTVANARSIDTLQVEGRFRDLVLCKLLGKLEPNATLPRKCDDVFQGWDIK